MNTTSTNEKSSEKLIEYVETLILAGKLKVDDRLPPERNLAASLGISRTAVREGILNGETEEIRTESDRLLHSCLVRMSGNRLVIANYLALNRCINRFIHDVRKKILDQSREEYEEFQLAHKNLAEAVINGDLEMGKEALDQHFVFITKDINI